MELQELGHQRSTILLTETYTFTPDITQPDQACAVNQTMEITVNPSITPTFTQVDPICNGDDLGELPTESNNGITGTWAPAIDNTATKTYTFTPDITQPDQACAVNQTMDDHGESSNYPNIHSSRPYL